MNTTERKLPSLGGRKVTTTVAAPDFAEQTPFALM